MLSIIEDLSKVIQVEIFIGVIFLPKNKARDLFTMSYILGKADIHLKRNFTFSIVMFTGKVVIFTCFSFADQLFFCLLAIVRVRVVTKQRY